MLTKVLLTVAIVVLALFVVPKLFKPRRAQGATPPSRVEELVPCPRCGIYRGRFDPCECGLRPTGGK